MVASAASGWRRVRTIGRLLKACRRGRSDAQEGVRERWQDLEPGIVRTIYFDAWERETRAMAKVGQLAQLALELQAATPTDAESPSSKAT